MSHEQKMLRLIIDNTQYAGMSNALKLKRNRLQHAIRRKALENATPKLDQKTEEIERLHDGANMFKSVRHLYRNLQSTMIREEQFRIRKNIAKENEIETSSIKSVYCL